MFTRKVKCRDCENVHLKDEWGFRMSPMHVEKCRSCEHADDLRQRAKEQRECADELQQQIDQYAEEQRELADELQQQIDQHAEEQRQHAEEHQRQINQIQAFLNNAKDEEEVRERQRAHEIAMQEAEQQKIVLQKEADVAKKSLVEVELEKQSRDAIEREKERRHEAAEREKQRQHETVEKEKERQKKATEREKERKHEKEMEEARIKISLIEKQREDNKREEAEQVRQHDIKKVQMEEHYKCERQKSQLKHKEIMQDKAIEKLRLEIEKLKYQSIPSQKKCKNNQLHGNQVPVECTSTGDTFHI